MHECPCAPCSLGALSLSLMAYPLVCHLQGSVTLTPAWGSLARMDLSHNTLTSCAPVGLRELDPSLGVLAPSLARMDLSHNTLTYVDHLGALTRLKELHLHDNQM